MLERVWLLSVLLLGVGVASADDPVSAVQGLISRQFPSLAGAFELEAVAAPENGHDHFEVLPSSSHVALLRGSSGVALASALNSYLTTEVKVQLSWSGDQVSLPSPLPKVQESGARRVTRPTRWSYYMNVCTV